MTVSELFLRRPVATCLLAFGLFLLGVVSYAELPVAPLPRVDFPTINVSAKLPGADPTTIAATVASPLERRLGQIPGVTELTSTSSTGSTNITAQFDLSRDIEGAAHDVQAAINASGSDLPVDLPNPPTYRKLNPGDAPILILAATAPNMSTAKLYEACDSILAQNIAGISGVAQVSVTGADKPAIRVQVDPAALNAKGLGMEDVRTLLAQSNINVPKGSIQGARDAHVIDTNSQLHKAADYAPLVLKAGDGTSLRLSDVANVIDGPENSRQAGWFNDGKAVLLIIQKQPNANVIETVDRIKAMLPQLEAWMPAGTKVSVLADRTQTIRASVVDVEITLLLSILLVVLVVLVSLGRVTPTLAVSITVPLSLAGAFAGMWLLGYSLDNISLLALTVSVGFVVDDAIVMIENIARYVEKGMRPIEAAIKGASEIAFTVFSISLSLIAVFIPLLFMGGIIGRLFREFAVTLSLAVAVSFVICITVTPTVYAYLMAWQMKRNPKPHTEHWGERVFNYGERYYEYGLQWVIRHRRFMLLVMVGTIVLTVKLYGWVPKGFFPQQDTGMMMAMSEARTDISFKSMAEKQMAAIKIVLADPAVEALGAAIGSGGGGNSNQGRMYIALKPLSERKVSADAVVNRLRPKLSQIDGISVFMQTAQDLRAGGRSTKAQFQFALSDESLEELREWTPKLIDRLRKEPGITDVSSDQDNATQQVKIIVDRDRASQLGIDMASIDQVLQDAFAQRQVSTIYTTRNQFHVVLEVDPKFQQDESALNDIYVKSTSGAQVRLSSFVTVTRELAPVSVMHQGQFPAATLSFNLSEGASLGDATDKIEQIAAQLGMPESVHYGFAGNAQAFAASLKDQPILILAALVAIYIVLGVLYESLLHPLTILSTLPSAGIGALLALMVAGLDLSIISVIGVILLMGIVKKNGIMLVDFAIMAEREGATPEEAILEACRKRFRPIMMTTLAAILGALPLIFTGGNGAELREPLGVAIVGGLLVSQMLTLFTTPVVYLALDRFSATRRKQLRKEATA